MPEQLQFTDLDAQRRIDVVLAERLQVSRARAHKLLAGATVNGRAVRPSHQAVSGQVLLLQPRLTDQIAAPLITSEVMPPVLFEDEHLLVVNKPRGLTVHAGAGEPQVSLVDLLRQSGRPLSSVGPADRAGIVHRLDKETSGAMVVAKTDEVHWKLAAAFEARQVRKTYVGLVCGVPVRPGRIEAPIQRHNINRKKMMVAPSGRPAVTEFHVRQKWEQFALLEINLLTGRTHQIRVHLAYVHHPVAGDPVYGGRDRALQTAPNEATRQALLDLTGQALHAGHLKFEHPVSGETMALTAELPPHITRLIESLDQ